MECKPNTHVCPPVLVKQSTRSLCVPLCLLLTQCGGHWCHPQQKSDTTDHHTYNNMRSSKQGNCCSA